MLNLIIVSSAVLVISVRIGDAIVKISAMVSMYYLLTNNLQLIFIFSIPADVMMDSHSELATE